MPSVRHIQSDNSRNLSWVAAHAAHGRASEKPGCHRRLKSPEGNSVYRLLRINEVTLKPSEKNTFASVSRTFPNLEAEIDQTTGSSNMQRSEFQQHVYASLRGMMGPFT